jgi:hypothetical protein
VRVSRRSFSLSSKEGSKKFTNSRREERARLGLRIGRQQSAHGYLDTEIVARLAGEGDNVPGWSATRRTAPCRLGESQAEYPRRLQSC